MQDIKANFAKAKQLRKESSETIAFKASKKLRLAEEALDLTELVVGGLIEEIEVLKSENK